ncbi:MAG: cytochrome c family protein [Planctomycetaceae bacterium]|nr:cytochrome c family protein [Planctomycetaceae bacterium]
MRTRHRATLLVACVLFASGRALAQDAAQTASPPAKFPLVSTDDCFKCHFTPAGNPAFAESRDFCHIETAAIWQQQDKHSQSLALMVTGEGRKLTQRIVGVKLEDVLRFDIVPPGAATLETAAPGTALRTLAVQNVDFAPPPEGAARADYDRGVATLKQCFACHAPVGERVAGGGKRKTIENGVSCQACHGAGMAYETVHQKPLWRLVKADDKEREFGLADLRNPARRIELCASCHVGTRSHDWSFSGEPTERFVRHEWYAKGHPPLPGLEFVTFAAQQPAHWRTVQEKLFRPEGFRYYRTGADAEDARNFLQFVLRTDKVTLAESYVTANPASFSPDPAQDMARAKEVLVSGLGVLATYAALVRDVNQAADAGLEFSVYDCGACHHELRSDFPTTTRVRRNVAPGRPPPAFWTLALARLGAAQAAIELEPAIAELDAAFSARPFGDRERMHAAADALSKLSWRASRDLAHQPLDNAAATKLLTQLAHPQHDVERDYHAARQYAWAIRELVKDLAGVPHRNYTLVGAEFHRPPASFVPEPLVKLLGGVQGARVPAEHEEVRRRIDALFDGVPSSMPGDMNWHMPLRLALPAGQEQHVIANLPDWLTAVATYDPEFFRTKLAPLQQAYPLK